jgi:hypothetical protein
MTRAEGESLLRQVDKQINRADISVVVYKVQQ